MEGGCSPMRWLEYRRYMLGWVSRYVIAWAVVRSEGMTVVLCMVLVAAVDSPFGVGALIVVSVVR
eukprot:1979366-Prorocentrum_lima.AAC.1